MSSLADVVSARLLRLWPERRHQERLLDLAERKQWGEGERRTAVDRLAAWLIAELSLPEHLVEGPEEPAGWLPEVRVDGVEPTRGVGRRTAALAALSGAEPKTLANTLAAGLRPDDRRHRWILFLGRLARGEVDAAALVFHRRSPANVAAALGRGGTPDAGDALLMMSLVTLWQRRRPTQEVRAARGVPVARRLAPKPAVALKWDVMSLGQVRPLLEHAGWLGGAAGQSLASIVFDAALTEAHLAPHRAHGNASSDDAWGRHWLKTLEEALEEARVVRVMGADEVTLFRWRIARMMAYMADVSNGSVDAPAHPYVALAQAIDDVRAGAMPVARFEPHIPGYFMLLPQARRRGLIEGG